MIPENVNPLNTATLRVSTGGAVAWPVLTRFAANPNIAFTEPVAIMAVAFSGAITIPAAGGAVTAAIGAGIDQGPAIQGLAVGNKLLALKVHRFSAAVGADTFNYFDMFNQFIWPAVTVVQTNEQLCGYSTQLAAGEMFGVATFYFMPMRIAQTLYR